MLWYVGFLVIPPVYPTSVLKTPFMPPNRESTPQNQPIAIVAVSVRAADSMGYVIARIRDAASVISEKILVIYGLR